MSIMTVLFTIGGLFLLIQALTITNLPSLHTFHFPFVSFKMTKGWGQLAQQSPLSPALLQMPHSLRDSLPLLFDPLKSCMGPSCLTPPAQLNPMSRLFS